jgi:hypothetical protein
MFLLLPDFGLVAVLALCTLGAGALLEWNRIASTQALLDRLAHETAETLARSTPSTTSASDIGRALFVKVIWTQTELKLDRVDARVSGRVRQIADLAYTARLKLVIGRFFGVSEMPLTGRDVAIATIRTQPLLADTGRSDPPFR